MTTHLRARGGLGLALLVIAVAASAVLAACRRNAPPPEFSHKFHLSGIACGGPGQPECLNCTNCHSPAERDDASRLPEQASCDGCHQDATVTQAVLATPPPRPHGVIRIDHEQHLQMPAIHGQCLPCHAGVVDAMSPAMPPMSKCFGCHEHEEQWERGECAPCHERQDLEQTLPVTFLKHDASFLRHHGEIVAQKQQMLLCQSCHTQSDCQSCHDVTQGLSVEKRRPERIESGQVHRGDFMARHAMEAQAEAAKCLTCHTPQTCDSCHAARGVSANVANARNPHPPGWVGNDTRSEDFHGTSARRDILACAGCHDAGPATNCIRCHKVGAYGGNPHPRGWKSARGTDAEMCGYCHGT